MKMKYRDNSYFNTDDYFLFDVGWRKFLTKLELYNGYYYTLESLQYKANSLPCVNFKEYQGEEVELFGFKGKVSKCMTPFDVGVVWNQGQKGVPYYWNDLNKLKF